MNRLIVLLLLFLAAVLDISLRLLPSTVGAQRELPEIELPQVFEGIDVVNVSGNENIFGLIPEDRKTGEGGSSSESARSSETQQQQLENVAVSLIAIYMDNIPAALIEVKDDNAARVGSLQKVVEGDQLDGFTVQSISAKTLVLASDEREVTFSVFNRSNNAGNE